MSIVKTLNKIVITKDVYNEFESSFYDDRHVEYIIDQFQFFVKNVLKNLNIQPSSLNGFTIWTHMLIWNI